VVGTTGRNATISLYDSPIDPTPPFRSCHGLEAGANRRGAAVIDALGDEFVDLGEQLFGESYRDLLCSHMNSIPCRDAERYAEEISRFPPCDLTEPASGSRLTEWPVSVLTEEEGTYLTVSA
jgi:hypothetical protein